MALTQISLNSDKSTRKLIKRQCEIPNFWEGSALFLATSFVWILVTIIAPIIFIVLYSKRKINNIVFYSCTFGCFVIGCVYLLAHSMPLLIELIRPTERPPIAPIISNSASAEIKEIKNLLIIANPKAGLGLFDRLFPRLFQPLLEEKAVTFQVLRTEKPGDATAFAMAQDLTTFDGIVIGGGDGTVHETLNGLLNRKEVPVIPIGLLPLGSANSLFSDFLGVGLEGLGEGKNLWGKGETTRTDLLCLWALTRILTGCSVCVDIVELTSASSKVFGITNAYFGLLGDLTILGEDLRFLGPNMRYDAAAVWSILKGNQKLQLSMKFLRGSEWGEWRGEAVSLVLNKSQHWTDTIRATPTSQLDSGSAVIQMLPITTHYYNFPRAASGSEIPGENDDSTPIIEAKVTTAQLLQMFLQVSTGAQFNNPRTIHVSTNRLKLDFSPKDQLMICIDGEPYLLEGPELDLEVHSNRVRLFVSRKELEQYSYPV
eukprot:Platyproteum_vivax@DN6911_c0_g1_i1.p1